MNIPIDTIIAIALGFIISRIIIMFVDFKAIIRRFRKSDLPKGTLHILRDDDGTYMSLELNDENSLSEIEEENQVIFAVEVHDTRSR